MRKLQISLPFQILQHKKSLHFIYPMPEKGTSFVGGGGGGGGDSPYGPSQGVDPRAQFPS